MADTHINAFFIDVEEAKTEVTQAKARLAGAEQALEVKKKEVNWQEPKASGAPVTDTNEKLSEEDTSEDPKPGTGSIFKKK